jgi:predicted  nucleic acid-binding Zn-ribbon protein
MPSNARQNDDLIVEYLALGHTIAKTAELAHVDEATIYRRKKSAAFRKRVADARKEMFAVGSAKVTAAMTAAIDTSEALLRDDSARIKIDAAKVILEYAVKTREHIDLSQQVDELRAEVAELKREQHNEPAKRDSTTQEPATPPDP